MSAAASWLFAESGCFSSCAQQLASGPTLRRSIDLVLATSGLAEAGIGIRRYEFTGAVLKKAACDADDAHAEARAGPVLALLYLATGSFEKADEEARMAGLVGKASSDPVSYACAFNDRGIAVSYLGRHTEA